MKLKLFPPLVIAVQDVHEHFSDAKLGTLIAITMAANKQEAVGIFEWLRADLQN